MTYRVHLTWAALVACLFMLIALPQGNAEEGTLNIALGSEPDDLNPLYNTGTSDFYDLIKIFSGLLKSDERLEMVPDLAESWEISPDGKTYTFHLRDGVKWQDGEDFSAEDVKFTYDLLRSGRWTSIFPTSAGYVDIDDVSVIDPKAVRFTIKEGIVPFQERFSAAILPKHILDGQDLSRTDFWQKPVGTGPYRFKHWKRGEELVLTSNPEYYGNTAKAEVLRYVFVPEEAARIGLLQRGDVDADKIDPRSMNILEGARGIKIYSMPSANWYALNLPNKMWPFEDKRVRKAIAYAINKKQILDTVFNGQGEIAYGPFRSEDWVYNPDIAFPYDPEKARQLLTEAGFKDSDGDGVLEKDGREFRFELIYGSTNPERKDIAIAVKSDLEKVGIDVEPVGKSWDEISPELFRSAPMVAAFGSPFDPDDNNYQLWSTRFIGQGWWNPASYSNPKVDSILEAARIEFDKDLRKQYYRDLQMILAEDQPLAFIVFCNYVYAINDKITGIAPRNAPHGQGTRGGINGEIWWNVENWQKE
ncbi:MAG: putative ABC transporter periplasmic-binding protein [Methanosaeta sp. PtaU1.Bin060]|nr:MAG: putative ABC transporter periplasmic-binding protein [Methanosaeta sp. PtaU1.Bin060]